MEGVVKHRRARSLREEFEEEMREIAQLQLLVYKKQKAQFQRMKRKANKAALIIQRCWHTRCKCINKRIERNNSSPAEIGQVVSAESPKHDTSLDTEQQAINQEKLVSVTQEREPSVPRPYPNEIIEHSDVVSQQSTSSHVQQTSNGVIANSASKGTGETINQETSDNATDGAGEKQDRAASTVVSQELPIPQAETSASQETSSGNILQGNIITPNYDGFSAGSRDDSYQDDDFQSIDNPDSARTASSTKPDGGNHGTIEAINDNADNIDSTELTESTPAHGEAERIAQSQTPTVDASQASEGPPAKRGEDSASNDGFESDLDEVFLE